MEIRKGKISLRTETKARRKGIQTNGERANTSKESRRILLKNGESAPVIQLILSQCLTTFPVPPNVKFAKAYLEY
jgi:hypothetical protein